MSETKRELIAAFLPRTIGGRIVDDDGPESAGSEIITASIITKPNGDPFIVFETKAGWTWESVMRYFTFREWSDRRASVHGYMLGARIYLPEPSNGR